MYTCVPMFTNHLHLQQHICIHASTGSSKFFLLSFFSARSSTSTGPHAHTTCAPVCPCSPTIYIFHNTSASTHPLAQVSFSFVFSQCMLTHIYTPCTAVRPIVVHQPSPSP